MMHCLNLNDPTISNIISRIGYLTTSDIITYNGIEILDIVKQQPFLDLKEEIKKSYQYQLNTKEFNQSIDDMVEISFWRIFTPSFYDWFGNWMIQYKLQNNLSLSEKEQDVLATKYQGSYDNLKADISKIVTEDGLPKLVYHSSLYDFPIFKNRDYIHFGTLKAAEDRLDVMIGRLPFTNDNQFSSILEEQLSNISSQPNAIAGITIKPYFLNIKKVIVSEDVIAGWTGKVLLDELNSGIEYKNELEDKGSISYAIRDINQTKSAILPSEDMSALLVKNLVEELKVTPEQAKPLIPTKFLNPTDSKIMYFQRLNDSTYGFVTPDGKVFIDKSTQSLNTPFHEFYHIYDKIILSNYSFDERAKSIIDKLNELVVESGYLDRVKKLDAYKNKSHDEQLAEARATLVGDAASSKINEAEYTFLMKIKKVLKDLVDYILDLIGTKSFKDYSPEQILNMTMEEFTNVMTYDMMYNRSFKDDLELEKIGYDFLKTIDGLNIDEPLIKNIIDAIGTNTLYEIIKYNGIEIFDIVNEKPFLELKKELKTAYQYQLKNKDFDKNIDTLVNISFWRMFTPYFYNWFGDWFIKYKIENNIDLNENEKSIFYNTYNNNYDNLNDNVSKVLTEQGVPKLVYHGSDYNFYEFKNLKYEHQLHHFGTFNSAFERVYRLSSEDLTSEDKINSIVDKRDKYVNQYMVDSYDALAKVTIKPYFLSIKKLFKSTDKGVNRYKDHLPEDVDGYQYKNTVEDIGSVSYATRKPDKIKSAIVASNDIYDILYNYLYKRKGLKLEESKKIMFSKFINLETNKNIYFQSLDLNNNQNNEISDDRKKQVEELFDSNPEIANQVYSKILTNSGISGENLLSLLLKDNIIEKKCS